MYPLYLNLRYRSFPWMSVVIVAVNILVFTIESELRLQGTLSGFVATWGLVPGKVTIAFASGQADLILWSCAGIFLSMFMHANFMHILLNMALLWTLAPPLEARMGRWNFLVFYLASGVAAWLALYLSNPLAATPSLGASGAIGGLLGAVLVTWPRARVTGIAGYPVTTNAFFFLLDFVVIQVMALIWGGNASPSDSLIVAYWAHVGGIILGVVAGIYLLHNHRMRPELGKLVQLPQQTPEFFDHLLDWLEQVARKVLATVAKLRGERLG